LDGTFVAYLRSKGTTQKLSVHDTHQQAGVAERRNRTVTERIRALLHSSGLPRYLWTEAARHAIWLLNRTTTKAVANMTPFEAVFNKKRNLRDVREFGERVWVQVEKGDKLSSHVREGHWLGVDEQSKGVRVWWPNTRTITVERNCYYDNTLILEGEEDNIQLSKTKAIAANEPTVNEPTVDDRNSRLSILPDQEPRAQRPSSHVRDLLEGRGTWSRNPTNSSVPPGVQLSAEDANDEHLNGWFDNVPT
jgi:hypothetical protein